MTTRSNDPIRDFIEANWVRYTRETITQQLLAAGHDRKLIDEAWEGLVAADAVPPVPSRPPSRSAITGYVIASFVVGLLATLSLMLLNVQSLSATLQFEGLWLLGYIVVGGIVGFFITRFRVAGAWWLLAAPLVPILYVVVWFGTCFAAYRTL